MLEITDLLLSILFHQFPTQQLNTSVTEEAVHVFLNFLFILPLSDIEFNLFKTIANAFSLQHLFRRLFRWNIFKLNNRFLNFPKQGIENKSIVSST